LIIWAMIQQAAARIDRPAPGHYQVRLSAVLSRQPVSPAPALLEPRAMARRQQRSPVSRRRTRQLALALESW
jgi:hypothetical protein